MESLFIYSAISQSILFTVGAILVNKIGMVSKLKYKNKEQISNYSGKLLSKILDHLNSMW